MCEKCVKLQDKCESIAKWLKERDMEEPTDEDKELLLFITHKTLGHSPIISKADILDLLGTSFLAGYKRGYEIHQLELMVKQ